VFVTSRVRPQRNAEAKIAEATKPKLESTPGFTAGDIRLTLLQAADALASIRRQFPTAEEPTQQVVPQVQGPLRRGVRWAFDRMVLGTPERPKPAAIGDPNAIVFDDPLDVSWARLNPALDDVAHVFHSHWFGIRAAAGYLPGHKIAIPSEGRLSQGSLQRVIAHLLKAKPRAVVFHGWSDNALLVANVLRETLGSEVRLLAVWHGNTAQFTNPFEFAQVGRLVSLKRKGILDALGSVKPDLHLMDDSFSKQVLLNVGPKVKKQVSHAVSPRTVLVPVPNDWRKNYFTNLYAAAAAGAKTVYVTTPLPDPMYVKVNSKVVVVPRPSRSELFALLPHIGLVMNATLSECQPMTALEGLAFGVPCITGPLSLGELDKHPYQRLAQISEVDTIGPVAKAVNTIFEMQDLNGDELVQMMTDYDSKLTLAAFARWEEFVR
jgi:hypothetical protein